MTRMRPVISARTINGLGALPTMARRSAPGKPRHFCKAAHHPGTVPRALEPTLLDPRAREAPLFGDRAVGPRAGRDVRRQRRASPACGRATPSPLGRPPPGGRRVRSDRKDKSFDPPHGGWSKRQDRRLAGAAGGQGPGRSGATPARRPALRAALHQANPRSRPGAPVCRMRRGFVTGVPPDAHEAGLPGRRPRCHSRP